MRSHELLVAVAVLASLGGCATAVPAMSGGSTTPKHRTDLALGGAARVPFGDLKGNADTDAGDDYVEEAEAGGVAPMAYARYGIGKHWDLGLMVSGTTVRADVRREKVLVDGTTRSSLVVGIAPFGGWITDEGGSADGGRVGGEVPFVYGVDFGGVYELWLGARASGEYVRGDFPLDGTREKTSGFGLRAGPLVGMALGIPRIHVLIELTAAYEHWFIDQGDDSFDRGGFVLIPAFAVRLRL